MGAGCSTPSMDQIKEFVEEQKALYGSESDSESDSDYRRRRRRRRRRRHYRDRDDSSDDEEDGGVMILPVNARGRRSHRRTRLPGQVEEVDVLESQSWHPVIPDNPPLIDQPVMSSVEVDVHGHEQEVSGPTHAPLSAEMILTLVDAGSEAKKQLERKDTLMTELRLCILKARQAERDANMWASTLHDIGRELIKLGLRTKEDFSSQVVGRKQSDREVLAIMEKLMKKYPESFSDSCLLSETHLY